MLLVSLVVFHLLKRSTVALSSLYSHITQSVIVGSGRYSGIVGGINAERISFSTGRNEGKEQYVNRECRSNKIDDV